MAICGDMWRYPKTRKSVIFLYFFGCGAVAICGDTPKIKKKTVFFEVFFLRLWRCGDMWRYPKTRKSVIFCIFFGCGAVAICGDTPKMRKTVFFEVFFPKAVALWRYVAIPENKKICHFFVFFWLWRCGDMWRYPKN